LGGSVAATRGAREVRKTQHATPSKKKTLSEGDKGFRKAHFQLRDEKPNHQSVFEAFMEKKSSDGQYKQTAKTGRNLIGTKGDRTEPTH